MGMTFSNAFEECTKNRKIICRKTNIKYVIFCQIPAIINEDVIPKMTSLSYAAKDIILATCKRISYNNQMLKINLNTGEYAGFISLADVDGDYLFNTDNTLIGIQLD